MSDTNGKKFKSAKKFWQISLLVLSLFALLVGAIGIGIQDNMNMTARIFVSLLLVLFIFVLVFSIIDMMVVYYVSPKGITLQSLRYKEHIPHNVISEFRLLSKEESNQLWHSMTSDALYQDVSQVDIFVYFKLRKKYKYLTRFTTITPSMITKGNDFRTTHVKTYISGQFILLAEQSDRKFLLTPQDAAGMVQEVNKYWTKPTAK
jgi:hypothetical protein